MLWKCERIDKEDFLITLDIKGYNLANEEILKNTRKFFFIQWYEIEIQHCRLQEKAQSSIITENKNKNID